MRVSPLMPFLASGSKVSTHWMRARTILRCSSPASQNEPCPAIETPASLWTTAREMLQTMMVEIEFVMLLMAVAGILARIIAQETATTTLLLLLKL